MLFFRPIAKRSREAFEAGRRYLVEPNYAVSRDGHRAPAGYVLKITGPDGSTAEIVAANMSRALRAAETVAEGVARFDTGRAA